MLAVKLVGKTLSCWAAKMVPASAPTIAAIAKAITLSLLTGIDIAEAASGSSFSARQDRPVRDVSSRCRTPARIAVMISAR